MNPKWKDGTRITKTLVQVVSLICAGVSIYKSQIWDFNKGGDSWWVAALLIAIFGSLLLVILDFFRNDSNIRIFGDKKSFFRFLGKERCKASASIINFGGDVSWLKDEKEAYFSLKKESPSLLVTVYYNKTEVTEETKCLIEEYSKQKIRMEPYPISGFPNVKGMITDLGKEEDVRMYIVSRYGEDEKGYSVAIYKNSDATLKFAQSFLFRFRELKRKIVIGISGINNVGKTTLSIALKEYYGKRLYLINDPFINNYNSNKETALVCIAKQLQKFYLAINSDSDIILFDRTPIDNYACLRLYSEGSEKQNDGVIPADKGSIMHDVSLREMVVDFTREFGLIILMIPEDQFILKATSKLDVEKRTNLKNTISELYSGFSKKEEYIVKYTSNKRDVKKNIISDILDDIIRKIDNAGKYE